MRRILKTFLCLGIFCSFLGIAVQTHALPTLFFDGNVGYTYTDGLLHVDAVLTGYQGLSSDPTLAGSSLIFNASLINSVSDTYVTTGLFGTSPVNPDITITGGGVYLILGEFSEILVSGANGFNLGTVSGQFMPTGGDLFGDFTSPSDMISLVFNLDTLFSTTMFNSDFNGQIDGRVSSVAPIPEPATWVLLGLGISGFMVGRKRRMACKQ